MTSQTFTNNWLEGNYEGLDPRFIGLNNDKFKFTDIKLFASDNHNEAHLFKDYRTVFDKSELTYLCVQATFENKMFNQQHFFSKKNWHAKISLRCGRKVNGSWVDVCFFDMSREIQASEQTVMLRNGWGNPDKGVFWTEGEYYWDVWINDKLLVLQYFYINDVGSTLYDKGRPYFKEVAFQFYDPFNKNGRFFKKFKKSSTVDIGFNTLLFPEQTKPFYGEFFFHGIYNREPFFYFRSAAYRFENIGNPEDYFQHWLNLNRFTEPGKWQNGLYQFTLTFLNTNIYTVLIEIGDADFVEGEFSSVGDRRSQIRTNGQDQHVQPVSSPDDSKKNIKSEADYLKEMDEFIGMTEIKKSIHDHIKYLKFIQLRQKKGFDDSGSILLHSVFTGNPGTGKTTIIRILGNIYRNMGLLSKGHVREADRSDLVGEFIGQTAIKVKRVIGEARGGILFIDEAYSLARKGMSSNDFGQEVIEILLKEMTSTTGDLAIMCAGYPKEMQEFLESNPGLKSRFVHFYQFDDYTPDELLQICEFSAKKNSIVLPQQTKQVLLDKLIHAYRDRDKNFGNARFANSIINEAKINLAKRLMDHPDLQNLSNEALSTVEPEDIEAIFSGKEKKQYKLEADEKLLQEGFDELNSLVGMSNIKQEVHELVKLIRYYSETNRDFLGKFSLHCVFTGNPGTGKTTVARIISKIYKALGLLERGHLVEVDRESLVAGYIGQTAIKTGEKINEAMGGTLFIDEAYALVQKQVYSDFGNEAIQVILKRMEDFRGQFGVIVAGYTENMHEFLESNPGLKSRFDKTFHFPDYNPDEMFEIGSAILAKEKLYFDEKAEAHLKDYFRYIYETRDKHFGNARNVRQVAEEIIRRQNLRMASLDPGKRNIDVMQTVSFEDVEKFKITR